MKYVPPVYIHLLRHINVVLELNWKNSGYKVCKNQKYDNGVATVAGVLSNRIFVHFDGWSYRYDYWTNVTSNYLHPVWWCKNNDINLVAPAFCRSNSLFLHY